LDHNQEKKISFLSAAILIVIAFFLIITVFFLSGQNSNTSILLPDGLPTHTQKPDNAVSEQDNFLKVSTDNVQAVVRTLSRPVSYHQMYHVTLSQGDRSISQIVDIWVDGPFLRADISSETGTASILTDGSIAYLWHSDEEGYSDVVLNETISVDDLLGLPTYELLSDIDPATLTEAAYLVLPEYNNQCIFVSSSASDEVTNSYWIDISSGLLFMANSSVQGQTFYTVQQKELDRLASDDEAFSDRLLLPDGRDPFSGE
jgi:hypothetical protein